MPSKLVGLIGSDEPAADTIAAEFIKGWRDYETDPNAPLFLSHNVGGNAEGNNEQLTEFDSSYLSTTREVTCSLSQGGTRTLTDAPNLVWEARDVYVDITAGESWRTSQMQMYFCRLYIDQWVFDHQTGPYTKSNDGMQSAIHSLENYSINWTEIRHPEEESIIKQYSGVISCIVQRSRID